MEDVKNIIPIFVWAKANAEATVVDRILVKIVPEMLKAGETITKNSIDTSKSIEVRMPLYNLIKQTAEGIVGSSFQGVKDV